MDTIYTYLKYRGDFTFHQCPFNDIDAAIFAALIGRDDLYDLTRNYKRFSEIKAENYVKEIDPVTEKTFYAVTYRISLFHRLIVFRGTDESLLSWKENFHTLHELPTAGQERAISYVEETLKNPFITCTLIGHSKGANLANYAAFFSSEKIQKKIKAIYSFDGPGFIRDLKDLNCYEAIVAKHHAFIPEDAVIGKIMEPSYPVQVVSSSERGLYQHELLTWETTATGFLSLEKTSDFSDEVSNRVNEWISSIPMESRKEIVDQLFLVLEENGIDVIDKLLHMDAKAILKLFLSATRLSSENRKLLGIIITSLKTRRS